MDGRTDGQTNRQQSYMSSNFIGGGEEIINVNDVKNK